MTRSEHLTVCDLRLTTRAPLYIGSGVVSAKTDYLFDAKSKTVSMIDPDALFALLYRKRLADQYERFVFSGDTRMDAFLKNCGITESERNELFLYTVNAEDALDDSHSLKEIHRFVRDSRHRAYVPGSSVKGALRTVILSALIAQEQKGNWPDGYSKKESAQQMQTLEGLYLNTLALKRDKNGRLVNDPVNSVLRGLSISDSEPVPDTAMILAGKSDVNTQGEEKKLPLCRECIRPGTELRFKLTLDHSALPERFSVDSLTHMIRDFDAYYQRTYLTRFAPPRNAHAVSYRDSLILGGGSGFFSKTLAYPYLGAQEGLKRTEEMMIRQFSRHGHDKDGSVHHISPHIMKYGKYQGELYPYGVCEVQII